MTREVKLIDKCAGRSFRVPIPDDRVECTRDRIEQSVADRFEQQVTAHADRRSVKTEQVDLTYEELNRLANRIAHAILVQLPASPEPPAAGAGSLEDATEPVAVLIGLGVEAIAAAIGVLKAGKVYVPLEPTDSRVRIQYILDDLPARVIVTNDQFLALGGELAPPGCIVINIDALEAGVPDANPGLSIPPDALAYVAYTSGSTGHPKGVMHTHRSLLYDTMTKTALHQISPNDRCSLLGSGTGQALKNATVALLNGASLYPNNVRREGVRQLADWLIRNQITQLIAVAPLFRSFLDVLTGHEQFPHLRMIRLASDRVFPDDVQRFQRHFAPHCALVNLLSSTETGTICAAIMNASSRCEGTTVPVGYPPDGTEVMLLGENGDSVAGPGVIAVRSPSVSCGYWRRPDLTEAAFRTEGGDPRTRLFQTADLGRRRPDGALEHLGRCDFQVKIRGHLVDTTEVEAVLLTHEKVRAAAVHAPENSRGDRSLVGYFVAATDPPVSVQELRRYLSGRLANHMVPSQFVMLESLPLLASGKVDRCALSGLHPAPVSPVSADDSLSGPIEEALSGIWSDILSLEKVRPDDDFFDLGGDSLLAFQLFARIEQRFGKRLPLALLYQHGTVSGIARHLAAGDDASRDITVIELQAGAVNRRRLFAMPTVGGELMAIAKVLSHLGADVPVFGLQPNLSIEANSQPIRFESIAAGYVQALRAVQPRGPYALIGYSFGALLAYEVARQITELGDAVELLVLVDKGPRGGGRASGLVHQLLRGRRILMNFPHWLLDDARNSPRDLYWRFRGTLRRFAPRWIVRMLGRARSRRPEPGAPIPRFPTQNPALVAKLRSASQAYVPQQYPGVVTLFRARTRRLFAEVSDDLGWRELAHGGIQIHTIPGHHDSILDEPHVRGLAKTLRECIDRLDA